MATTLRHLLVQRAARLQQSPALTTQAWGRLSYAQLRNRAEGVALGLLSTPDSDWNSGVYANTGGPWDWAAELAAACCGFLWTPSGTSLSTDLLGGPRFNHEEGRQAYHDREDSVLPETPFMPGFDHATLLLRLQRLNRKLGWDHRTEVRIPISALKTPSGRAALWSALYAGAHALVMEAPVSPHGIRRWFAPRIEPSWDPTAFETLFKLTPDL